MPRINLDRALHDRVKKVADAAGYSSPEEFVIHVIERELSRLETPEDDPRVEERLRGLGYLE